jgi:hypothetical protein
VGADAVRSVGFLRSRRLRNRIGGCSVNSNQGGKPFLSERAIATRPSPTTTQRSAYQNRLQSPHLLLSAKLDEFTRHGPLDASNQ